MFSRKASHTLAPAALLLGYQPTMAETTLRIAMMASDIPPPPGCRRRAQDDRRSNDPKAISAAYRKAHEGLVDNPPWLFIVHDLNPREMSPKIKGFVSPQSWFVDLTLVAVQ